LLHLQVNRPRTHPHAGGALDWHAAVFSRRPILNLGAGGAVTRRGIGQGDGGWAPPLPGTRRICRTENTAFDFQDTFEHSSAASSCSAIARGFWRAATSRIRTPL